MIVHHHLSNRILTKSLKRYEVFGLFFYFLLNTAEIMADVFTYGSLMYPEVFHALVPNHYESTRARLKDHVRREVSGEVYPGLKVEQGGEVWGVVYL
jgi:cation transport regulator ChaC